MKKDIRGIINFIVLISQFIIYDIYLVELFWGDINKVIVKAIYYFSTASILLYFTFDEMKGYNTLLQYNIKIVYNLCLVSTFYLFVFILDFSIKNQKTFLFLHNSLIIAISAIILLSGLKYGIFKRNKT